MIKMFTIGFTKKTAKVFFDLLLINKISKLVDIRLNNSSQLAGFAKGKDLEYFINKICLVPYEHNINLAPTEKLLSGYKNKEIDWDEYQKLYTSLLSERNIIDKLEISAYENACFLCSEHSAEYCHRRLFLEYLKKYNPAIEIIHL
jgi:uncharacterized protein (DUF488 family)